MTVVFLKNGTENEYVFYPHIRYFEKIWEIMVLREAKDDIDHNLEVNLNEYSFIGCTQGDVEQQ